MFIKFDQFFNSKPKTALALSVSCFLFVAFLISLFITLGLNDYAILWGSLIAFPGIICFFFLSYFLQNFKSVNENNVSPKKTLSLIGIFKYLLLTIAILLPIFYPRQFNILSFGGTIILAIIFSIGISLLIVKFKKVR